MKEKEEKKVLKRKKPRSKASMAFLIFWLILVGLSFALVAGQARTYNELRAQEMRLYAQVEAAREANRLLNLEVLFFDSDLYIEQIARNRLGMVLPHEIVFRNMATFGSER